MVNSIFHAQLSGLKVVHFFTQSFSPFLKTCPYWHTISTYFGIERNTRKNLTNEEIE